jgi:hypothetical protein
MNESYGGHGNKLAWILYCDTFFSVTFGDLNDSQFTLIRTHSDLRGRPTDNAAMASERNSFLVGDELWIVT